MTAHAPAHDTLKSRIIALALDGVTPALIEERLSGATDRGYIYGVIAQARADGVDIPHFSTHGGGSRGIRRGTRYVHIAPHTWRALAGPAAVRGLSVSALAGQILDEVAADGLIDAVLDDAEDAAPRRASGPGPCRVGLRTPGRADRRTERDGKSEGKTS